MNAPTNSCFHCDMRPRTFYVLLSACWLLLSVSFIATLPSKNFFGHDTGAHIQYTQYIRAEKKLPSPWHGWQTYQPPAYYLVNQLFAPQSQHHVVAVRLSSVAYGLLFLLACHSVMNIWRIPKSIQLLTLLYFMSIPAFLYLFTAYNNDALAMTIAGIVPVVAMECYRKPRVSLVILLVLLSTLGVYTKYSLVLVYGAIGAVLVIIVLFRRINFKKSLIVLFALFLGCLTILPYFRFHNYTHTGKYFPYNNVYVPEWNIRHTVGWVNFLFMPPGLTSGEWTHPFAFNETFHATLEPIPFYWTKKNYLSSLLSTSLFGEFNYSAKVPSADKWAWVTLWVHIILLLNIGFFYKKNILLTSFLMISLAVFASFVISSLYTFNAVNFRLFAWVHIPLSVLVATAITRRIEEKNTPALIMLSIVIVLGIFSHLFYQFTLNTSLP